MFSRLIKNDFPASGRNNPEVTSFVLKCMTWSMFVSLSACLLMTFWTYCIGNIISCITGAQDYDEHVAIENYCYISGTFTILNLNSDEAPHPGVGPPPLTEGCDDEAEDCVSGNNMRRYAYYQWVPMVLFLQAAIYYLPKYIWKVIDSSYFKETLCGLNYVYTDSNLKKLHIEDGAKYFNDNFNTHRIYAVQFLFCEIIAFSIAVGNLYFTNTFLGGDFFDYGNNALHYLTQPASSTNPLDEVFPKVSKCTWHLYGPSGTVTTHDTMCVLPINAINEKIYLFLWMFYVAIATFTGIVLLWDIVLFVMPSVRNAVLLKSSRHSDTKENLQHLLPKCNYGDWFLIYQYMNHMAYFKEWVQELRRLNAY